MRFFWLFLILLAGAALAVAITPAAQTAQLNRDILWATVKLCVASQKTIGAPLPCSSVDLGDEGRPGFALLHVPGQATHHVLMPIDDIAGIESPQLQGREGAALFREALAARQRVSAAARRPIPLSDIGLAINSAQARSQDHLHIHLDCVRAGLLDAILSTEIGEDWSWLPMPLGRRRYIARRVRGDEVAGFNPFASLRAFVPDPKLMVQASLAAVPDRDSGLILLADLRPQSLAERLLDHSCAILRP